MLSHTLKEAQAQRDAAQATLGVSQQELTVRDRQLMEVQKRAEVLEEYLQNATRERTERDKQWHTRCETIKAEWEERLKHNVDAINEDCRLRCLAVRDEWSNKLQRDLELANAEWSKRLEMREMELKSQYKKEMDRTEAEVQQKARFDMERKRLHQELTAAREIIRVSNDAAGVEITRRMTLEHQLEDVRIRERIHPELVRALLLVDTMARYPPQATSLQHSSASSAPLSLADFSKNRFNTEEPPDSSFAGDLKRRRLS